MQARHRILTFPASAAGLGALAILLAAPVARSAEPVPPTTTAPALPDAAVPVPGVPAAPVPGTTAPAPDKPVPAAPAPAETAPVAPAPVTPGTHVPAAPAPGGPSTPQTTATAPPAPAEPPASRETFDPATIFRILGQDVKGPTNIVVAQVTNVLVDAQGQPRAAVLDYGGFLGVGKRRIAVAWRTLSFGPDGIRLSLSREQLRGVPDFKEAEPSVLTTQPAPVVENPATENTEEKPATE